MNIKGGPASGKTTITRVLSRLITTSDEEHSAATLTNAAINRVFARSFENCPTVIDLTNAKEHWIEDKRDLFNGETQAKRRAKTMGTAPENYPFKSTLCISGLQETPSKAVQARMVNISLDRNQHTQEGKHAVDRLLIFPAGTLLPQVDEETLMTFFNQFHDEARDKLPSIGHRVASKYATLYAVAKCLPLFLPLSENDVFGIQKILLEKAQGETS